MLLYCSAVLALVLGICMRPAGPGPVHGGAGSNGGAGEEPAGLSKAQATGGAAAAARPGGALLSAGVFCRVILLLGLVNGLLGVALQSEQVQQALLLLLPPSLFHRA